MRAHHSVSLALAFSLALVASAQAKPKAAHTHRSSAKVHATRPVPSMQSGRTASDMAVFGRNEPLIVLPNRTGVDTVFKSRQGGFYGNQNYYSDLRNWGY